MGDDQYKTKLNVAFQITKAEFESEVKRFHELDNKFNMLLVVFVCVATGVGFFVPSQTGVANSTAIKIIIYILIAFMATSLVLIIAGFFPREYARFDVKKFVDVELYELGEIDFLSRMISSYVGYVACLRCVNKRKVKCLKFAYITTSISFVMLAVAILCAI